MPFLRQQPEQQDQDTANYTSSEVFYVPETGQIYEDYEKYIESLVLKNQSIWTCKYTGKNKMTFWEALDSERKSQELLDNFPDQWKAPVLRMVQHSYDSPDLIATQLTDFCKGHFLQGEYVRIDINSDVRYWGEILTAVHGIRTDGSDSSEYKVSLAADPNGTVIGEASFVGTPPFTRIRNIPNKTLIKKFIRSCASRNLFPGSPWIVNAELVKRYGLKSELPAHLAEAALKAAKALSISEVSSATSLTLEDEYPKADEDLPVEKTLPIPSEITTSSFDKVVDVWMFCQAFAAPLRLSPFSLKDFTVALQHPEFPNPLLEAVNTSLLALVSRERKTKGQEALAGLYSRSALFEDKDDSIPLDADDETPAVFDHLQKIKWWDNLTGIWWVNLTAFLKEFSDSAQLEKSHWVSKLLFSLDPAFVRATSKGYLKFSTEERVSILHLMVKLCEVLPIVRQHVDSQQERAIEERKDRRQMDIDRNKLSKEIADMERELQEATPPEDQEIDHAKMKELRKMEAAIRKAQTQEAQMTKKSETLFKEERKASSFRINCLGSDRDHRMYWWLDFHLLAGQIDSVGSNMVLVEDPKTNGWFYFDEAEQLESLRDSLNIKGVREAKLLKHLDRTFDLIVDDLRPQTDKKTESTESVNTNPEEPLAADQSESDEEMIVVPKRRGRRPKTRRVSPEPAVEVPAFLKYKNSLATKK